MAQSQLSHLCLGIRMKKSENYEDLLDTNASRIKLHQTDADGRRLYALL